MIKSFRHKGLAGFFLTGSLAGIQPAHGKRLRLILGHLQLSTKPQDMALPELRLHAFMRITTNMAAQMFNPPHPGEVIKELCLDPLGLSVTAAAEALGVSRKTLSAILNCRAGISPEMAIRLSKAFGTTPEVWLKEQMQYDLWQAQKLAGSIKVKRITSTSA